MRDFTLKRVLLALSPFCFYGKPHACCLPLCSHLWLDKILMKYFNSHSLFWRVGCIFGRNFMQAFFTCKFQFVWNKMDLCKVIEWENNEKFHLMTPSLVLFLMDDIFHYSDNTGRVNEGWADAMARILFKNLPEGKVLSCDNNYQFFSFMLSQE